MKCGGWSIVGLVGLTFGAFLAQPELFMRGTWLAVHLPANRPHVLAIATEPGNLQ